MRIDAHQHCWLLADRDGQWPPADLTALYRDFQPADLQPELAAAGIDGTVVVQSLPSVADSAYLVALAAQTPFIRGVVGWVDLKAEDAAETLQQLAQHTCFKGVRPMLQSLPEVDWLDDPVLEPAMDALVRLGLVFDALVLPVHLPALIRFARRYPALPLVIDHAAKPHIAAGTLQPWQEQMAQLAALPQVHCKLSGLLTEAGADRSDAALQPYVQVLLTLFGPQRLIWGSDWPVLQLAGDYAGWLAQCERLLAGLTPAERDAVFGGNAHRFYRL